MLDARTTMRTPPHVFSVHAPILHRVRIFSWKRPRPLAVLRSHEESVYTVAHSPRLGGLASGSKDSRIALWDVFSEGRRKRQDPTPDTL